VQLLSPFPSSIQVASPCLVCWLGSYTGSSGRQSNIREIRFPVVKDGCPISSPVAAFGSDPPSIMHHLA
jgi:hypothetical protein